MQAGPVLDIVAKLYDAALDQALWPHVIEECVRFVGGSAGNLSFRATDANPRGAVFSFGFDPAYQQAYNETYTRLNPISLEAGPYRAGDVVAQSDIVPHREMRETRFYQEWLALQGIEDVLFGLIEKSASAYSLMAVRRKTGDGEIDGEARRRLSLLVPHVRRAVHIANCLEFRKAQSEMLAETLDGLAAGVVLVGPSASIAFANTRAKELLDEGSVIRNGQGTIKAVSPQANASLQKHLATAEGAPRPSVSDIVMPLPSEPNRHAVAHLLPLRRRRTGAGKPYTALFVRESMPLDSGRGNEAVAVLHGLTEAEARVLRAMVDVGGVPACAEFLGVAPSTVRTHLQRIFRKTGTNRQADLVKLVVEAQTPFVRSAG